MASHKWQFKSRFRAGAYGWRENLPVQRVKEAVKEIKSVARSDPVLGAEGAVAFIERLVPAIEGVDGSSGRIGTAVGRALSALVPIIAKAPADERTRADWLERLFEAHSDDGYGYLESLADDWGTMCASPQTASVWADDLLPLTRRILLEEGPGAYFHGTVACLSALYAARRFEELRELLQNENFWGYLRWAVLALAAEVDADEAVAIAESSRGPWTSGADVDAVCEKILLDAGRRDEAYRYGLRVHSRSTYTATFRAVAAAYPERDERDLLSDLVATSQSVEPGKWFAAAKDAGLLVEAIELGRKAGADPKTLARAARDYVATEPGFAANAGMLAVRSMARGEGFDVTGADVRDAVFHTVQAAQAVGSRDEVVTWLRQIASTCQVPIVGSVLANEVAAL